MWLSAGGNRYLKQLIHHDQVRFCMEVIAECRASDIPVSPAYLAGRFHKNDGVCNNLWSARRGRLTAMILQLARYGDFQPHDC